MVTAPPQGAGGAPPGPGGTDHQVFLSYSRRDEAACAEVFQKLTAQGYRVFWDQEGLLPGDRWQRVLSRAVDESRVLILLVGHEPIEGWVSAEVEAALSRAHQRAARLLPKMSGAASHA